MMKTIKQLLALVLGIILVFNSCKKDEIPPIPVLPPVSSFSMEYDDFQQNKSAPLIIKNWLYSVVNVSIFSTIVSANMVVPTIAFSESFNYEPTYIGDQTWQWSYEFIGIGSTYKATLNGIAEKKNKVRWEMYVDKIGTNSFTNFLWFEGTTTDTTAAVWTVYENPLTPSVLFDIEWDSNSDHTKSILKYTYRNTGSTNTNSTIEFGKEPENNFDRYYNIFIASENSIINIEWNSELKYGHVKSPTFYNDENWHCWDEYLLDAWCD
jgi:hypothetical protein